MMHDVGVERVILISHGKSTQHSVSEKHFKQVPEWMYLVAVEGSVRLKAERRP
jgi:hypothetical protein